MSENKNETIGTVGWFDITVNNAEDLMKFYQKVVGWKPEPVSMGKYNDYVMTQPENGTPIAGICHSIGGNADLPKSWLMYITVDDLEKSITEVLISGGLVLTEIKKHGDLGLYCVIQDPSGGVVALYQNIQE